MSYDRFAWMAETPEPVKTSKAKAKIAKPLAGPSAGSLAFALRKAGAEIEDVNDSSATEEIDAPGRAGD